MNSLEKWIRRNGGSEKTAKKLGVTQRAVDKWRNGKIPNLKNIKKILKASRGRINPLYFLK